MSEGKIIYVYLIQKSSMGGSEYLRTAYTNKRVLN